MWKKHLNSFIRKKYLIILMILAAAVAFAACGNGAVDGGCNTGENAGTAERNDSESGNSTEPLKTSGGLRMLTEESSKHTGSFAADSGYYYLTEYGEIGRELYGNHLMYVDYATKQEVYLCTDSSCRHDSKKCSAVFDDSEFGIDSMLFVHKDNLYVVARDYDMDGVQSVSMSEEGSTSIKEQSIPAVLYRMGLDGSMRKKIFAFPADVTVEKMAAGDDDNLWFITKKLSFEREDSTTYVSSMDRSLVKLDLSKNELTDRISLDFGDNRNYKVIGVYGTQFVLSSIEYPDGLSESDMKNTEDKEFKSIFSKSSMVYDVLDTVSGSKREVYRVSNGNGYILSCAVGKGYLFAEDYDKCGILKISLDTGKVSTLVKDSKKYYIYKVLRDSLCCWNDNDTEDATLYFIDMETGKISHCTLTNKSLGWYLDILADNDGQVLVIYDYDAKDMGDGSYEVEQYKYALISKKDLYNSLEKYEPVSMAGRGK